jgi:hypothetical protein
MKNRDFLFLLIGATLVFAAVSYALQLPENSTTEQFISGDPISYWEASKLIYTEGSFPHPLRPYFYPFLIGLRTLFRDNQSIALTWALGLNFIFWLATAGFIFSILRENTNRKIAFVGAFIFIFNTSNIINCWSVLAESLFHFLIIGSVYFLLKFLKNSIKSAYFIAFSTFSCLSFITRPTFYPLLFLLIPLFFWAVYRRYLTFFIATITALIFVSTIGFSLLRMHQTYGNWTLSYIGDCAWYSFFGAYATVVKPEKSWDDINADWRAEATERSKKMTRYHDSIPWSTLPTLVREDMKAQFSTNKMGLLLTFIRDLASNSVASNGDVLKLTNVQNRPFFAFILRGPFWWSRFQNILSSLSALCLPFVFYRFKRYFWANNRSIYWILGVNCALSLFAVLISTVSFSQGDRFHLVVLPLNVVSWGIFYFYRQQRYK